jgi:hypothetical protein
MTPTANRSAAAGRSFATVASDPKPAVRKFVMVASDWKPGIKNTRQGFLTLTLASGMILHKCTYERNGSRRWIGLPSQEYTKADGSKSFANLINFADRATKERFQAEAIDALDVCLGVHEPVAAVPTSRRLEVSWDELAPLFAGGDA